MAKKQNKKNDIFIIIGIIAVIIIGIILGIILCRALVKMVWVFFKISQ